MNKVVKKIFLPAGLIVSMYNLYSGKGNTDDTLSMFDVEIMCAFLEFYFNYTNPDAKKYIYRFYTVPHFYTSKSNMAQDEELLKRDRALRDRYAEIVRDDGKALQNINALLINEKKDVLNKYMQTFGRELDDSLLNRPGLPQNHYEIALQLSKQNFRLGAFYNRGLFANTTLAQDLATFYILKENNSSDKIGKMQFFANENEVKSFLSDYFLSSSYKAIEEIEGRGINGNYAPELDTFIDCFKKASGAFSALNFEELNKKYIKEIKNAGQNMVEFEIIS